MPGYVSIQIQNYWTLEKYRWWYEKILAAGMTGGKRSENTFHVANGQTRALRYQESIEIEIETMETVS